MTLELDEFFTKTDLKRRGWTESIIKKIGIKPDKTKPNPIYKNAPEMKLFNKTKIQELETSEKFKSLLKNSMKRKKTAQKAVITKKEKLIRLVDSWTIEIPKIDDLFEKAIEHYNDWEHHKENRAVNQGKSFNYDSNFISLEGIDKSFLYRITVNFIRHELTCYEKKLEKIVGKTGKSEAYIKLKIKILDAIADTYPNFKEECECQKNKIKRIIVEKEKY